jgi:putative DNA primase/helicase
MKCEEMQADDANGSEKLLSAADGITVSPKLSDGKAADFAWTKARTRFIRQHNPAKSVTVKREGFPDITISNDMSVEDAKERMKSIWRDASDAVSVSSNGDAEAAETPLEPSVNRDVVVGMAQVTPLHSAALALGRDDEDRLKDAVIYALTYAASGIPVLPLNAGMKNPVGALVHHGLSDASTDPVQIQKWFGNDNPNKYNVGGVMGNGLIAVDIDKKPHKNQDGYKVIKALEPELGELIASPIAQSTPSGGEHWIYKLPESVAVKSPKDAFKERGSGLDIRADGSYIVLAPSVLGDKDHEGKPQIEGQYRWNYFSTLRDWRDLLNECTLATMNDGKWFDAIVQRYGKDRKSGTISGVPAPVFDGEAIEMTDTEKDGVRYTLGFLDADDYDDWVAAGLSLKRYGKVGFDLWIEWASSSEKFDPDAHAKRWSGFSGQPTKASIFKLAEDKPGYANPSTTCAQAAEAERKAVKEAERDELFGTMPKHLKADQSSGSAIPVLGGVDKFPDVVSLREKITTDGVAARQKFGDGDSTYLNSAKWLALGLLNADEDTAVQYQDAHPKTSEGDTRKLVVGGKVDWKVFTFTVVKHIAGEALLMMGKLEGGFKGLSAASQEKLVDLVHVLLLSNPIGAVWRELEASSNKLDLRKTIADACDNVQNKSKRKPPRSGATQHSNVSVPSNGVADAVSAPVAPVETAAPVAVQNTSFSILNRPIHLGGTAPNPEPHVICAVSANTVSDAVSQPAPAKAVESVQPNALVVGVVDDSDEKESSVDRLYRLAKKEFRREWVYDPIAKAVYAPNGSGTYTRLDKDAVEREITRLKDTYGVSVRGFNDIVSARRLLEGHLDLVEWSAARHLLPFKNTVYDTEQNEKLPYDLCPKFNWQLPYDFDPRATCPVFDEFILKAVNYDPGVVKTLQAFMRCLIAGDYSVKKFVELNGPSDSGKTQYMNICVALVGRENTVSSTLKMVEDKQFETRRFYGKRLGTFPDQSRFYGDSQVFRNLTGGDAIRNEGKNVDTGDDYVFEGLVIVTANDWMNPKNNGGAIMKRRIPIEFPIAATADEIAKYAKHKGIANYIATHEMPGVMNWVLGMSLEDAQAQLRKPDAKTRELNEKVEHDNSTVLSWLQENAARCERGEESPVGKCVPAMFSQATGDKMNTQPRDYGLFADFCDHCKGIGQVAMNRINFTKEIMSVCRQRSITVEYTKERLRNNNRNQYILTGIRLRKDTDEVEFFG